MVEGWGKKLYQVQQMGLYQIYQQKTSNYLNKSSATTYRSMLISIRVLQQEYFKSAELPINCQDKVLYRGISIKVH
jgi:hypothetical protein